MVLRASHGALGVNEHPIGDGLWQRVLEALRREPYMHLRDLIPAVLCSDCKSAWKSVPAYGVISVETGPTPGM